MRALLLTALAGEAFGARLWDTGWSLVYFFGCAWGVGNAIYHGDSAPGIADGALGAAKSATGLVRRGVAPLHAARGADELALVSAATPAARRAKLVLGERLLLRNARETERRFSWKVHLISPGLNIATGAIVWALGDLAKAGQSTGLAIVTSELAIWTQPARAKHDLADYQRHFGRMNGAPAAVSPPSAAPSLAGMQIRF